MAAYALFGKTLLGSSLVPASVMVEDRVITGIERGFRVSSSDLAVEEVAIIAPGFIDLQVNGGFGCRVEEGLQALETLSRCLPSTGVTSFLPTVISSAPETYRQLCSLPMPASAFSGARPLGWHLEGPLLSPQRAGAHRTTFMVDGSDPLLLELACSGTLCMMTVAPEMEGATGIIRYLCERGIIVSLGHTGASFEEFIGGGDAGATMVTHLFNAMSPFLPREPSATAAALLDDRLCASLIADGVHSHPAALELALRTKGADRIALVTDMVSAAGVPDGSYGLGDQQVIRHGNSVRTPDGTLGGSVLLMDQAVRTMTGRTRASTADALRMASEVPAGVLGLAKKGQIRTGFDADLVLLDGNHRITGTIVAGERVYSAPGP